MLFPFLVVFIQFNMLSGFVIDAIMQAAESITLQGIEDAFTFIFLTSLEVAGQ